jgi:hypothetical protein
MSQVAISGNASGTGTLTIAAPNTNSNYTLTLPTNTGTIVTNKTAGTVLQVVSATKTDTFSTANTSYTATGLSAAITPSSTSSKILVIISAQIGITTNGYGSLQLFRSGSVISGSTGDAAGSRLRSSSGNTFYSNSTVSLNSMTIMYLDTPSSISSLTYELYIRRGSESTTLYLNRSGGEADNENHARGASTITLMEIAA